MNKVWFTSDTHFSQRRTLELSRRPFSTTQEMDKCLIDNWNKVVGPEDVVFHLGDFGNPYVVKDLSGGEIYLLPGNYDDWVEVVEEMTKYDKRVVVLDSSPYHWEIPFQWDNAGLKLPQELYFVHEPERAVNPNYFYLYGHIHQLQMVKRNGLNVGVDCHQFTPIDLETVAFYYNAIVNHYDENVFMEKLG